MLEVSYPPVCVSWWGAMLPDKSGGRTMRSPFCLKDCHKTECVAFGFILLLKSTLIYFGCHRHCLLSASNDNLCKGKSHQIPPVSKCPLWREKKTLRRWWAEMQVAPQQCCCSAPRGGRAGSADGSLSFPSLPAGAFHCFPSRQLSYQHNPTACRVALASATVTPEMLREVMGRSSPLI